MGTGKWSSCAYNAYTTSVKGMDSVTYSTAKLSVQDNFKSRSLDKVLNPYNVMRECCDSEEHPYSFPVILALDVTGSMGSAANRVAQKLNEIMTDLYSDDEVQDVEFCIMAIGDLDYDHAPIQISQFESDIRIAEQLDKVYFEGHGGGNTFESYTAAWYMGVKHCVLDAWKRGRKGVIITMGDELPNPYLPKDELAQVTGDKLQGNIETKDLLPEVLEKYDVFHISVDDSASSYTWNNSNDRLDKAWTKLLGKDHYFVANLNNLAKIIVEIVKSCYNEEIAIVPAAVSSNNDEVIWA